MTDVDLAEFFGCMTSLVAFPPETIPVKLAFSFYLGMAVVYHAANDTLSASKCMEKVTSSEYPAALKEDVAMWKALANDVNLSDARALAQSASDTHVKSLAYNLVGCCCKSAEDQLSAYDAALGLNRLNVRAALNAIESSVDLSDFSRAWGYFQDIDSRLSEGEVKQAVRIAYCKSALAPERAYAEITSQPSRVSQALASLTMLGVDASSLSLADVGKYIYLVKGVDAGRNAWYYVLVDPLCKTAFLAALDDDIIHLENHGKVLASAFGDVPPESVTTALKQKYHIDDTSLQPIRLLGDDKTEAVVLRTPSESTTASVESTPPSRVSSGPKAPTAVVVPTLPLAADDVSLEKSTAVYAISVVGPSSMVTSSIRIQRTASLAMDQELVSSLHSLGMAQSVRPIGTDVNDSNSLLVKTSSMSDERQGILDTFGVAPPTGVCATHGLPLVCAYVTAEGIELVCASSGCGGTSGKIVTAAFRVPPVKLTFFTDAFRAYLMILCNGTSAFRADGMPVFDLGDATLVDRAAACATQERAEDDIRELMRTTLQNIEAVPGHFEGVYSFAMNIKRYFYIVFTVSPPHTCS